MEVVTRWKMLNAAELDKDNYKDSLKEYMIKAS